jgi:ribosomal protein L37AE/L43A
MAKGATTLSEVREQEYTRSVMMAATGLALIIVGVLVIAFLKYLVPTNILGVSRVLVGLAALLGATLVAAAGKRVLDMRNMATVLFKCPYCDTQNKLLAPPTEDFECESCHATVRFENGKMVPIRTIICTSCGAEHRVSSKAERYVCDRCNAVISVQQQTQQVYGMTPPPTPMQRAPAMVLGGANQNVLLTAVDRSREQQIAAILQRELGVDLNEARRLLGTLSDRTPLIVGYDLPFDQAEGLRKQFEQLGATVAVRATA